MGEALIIQKTKEFSATIIVTYPAGTCTVTGEGQTYTHSGGGSTTFTVKKKGTYSISGVDSVGGTGSASAVITKSGENVVVSLKYTLMLFNNGSVSGKSWAKAGHSKCSIGTNIYLFADATGNPDASQSGKVPNSYAYTNAAVNLSSYSKLYFYISSLDTGAGTSSNNYIRCGVASSAGTSPSSYVTAASGKTTAKNKTVSVDISSLTSGFISIHVKASASGISTYTSNSIYITKVWAES